MKNWTILIAIAFVSSVCGCSEPSSKKKTSEQLPPEIRNDLPKMFIKTLAGVSINTRELKGNTILILFQPECDHCQREAKEIREHLDEFKKYQLYFISTDATHTIEKFASDYDLLGHANIYFGAITVDAVINNFGSIPAPSVYIYSDQQLVEKFNGEVAIEKILQAI